MSGRSRSEAVVGREALSAKAPAIYFELERFERGEDDRLELTGRWFGIRGRRFVRPTLTGVADGDRVRALADLEHKPWAADDGEPWQAAFKWRGHGDVAAAELAVAPDLAVELPPLGTSLKSHQRLVPLPRPVAIVTPEREREPEPAPAPEPAPEPAARGKRRPPQAAEVERLKAEIDELRSEIKDTTSQLAAMQSERDELAAALERTEAMVEELRGLTERSDAQDEETRRTALAERDRALAERDRALAERDAAIVQRDQAAVQRDAAIRERDRLATERDQAVAAHAAGLVMRDAVRYSSPARHEGNWTARLVAIALLAGALIACGIVLRVL